MVRLVVSSVLFSIFLASPLLAVEPTCGTMATVYACTENGDVDTSIIPEDDPCIQYHLGVCSNGPTPGIAECRDEKEELQAKVRRLRKRIRNSRNRRN